MAPHRMICHLTWIEYKRDFIEWNAIIFNKMWKKNKTYWRLPLASNELRSGWRNSVGRMHWNSQSFLYVPFSYFVFLFGFVCISSTEPSTPPALVDIATFRENSDIFRVTDWRLFHLAHKRPKPDLAGIASSVEWARSWFKSTAQ